MADGNADNLYLIPSCLSDCGEFSLSLTTKFIRCLGGVYKHRGPGWLRKDGDPCDEEPGMIYAMGHMEEVLPPITRPGAA